MNERFAIYFSIFFPFHAGLSPFWKGPLGKLFSPLRSVTTTPIVAGTFATTRWEVFCEKKGLAGLVVFGGQLKHRKWEKMCDLRSTNWNSRLMHIRFVPVCMKWDRYILCPEVMKWYVLNRVCFWVYHSESNILYNLFGAISTDRFSVSDMKVFSGMAYLRPQHSVDELQHAATHQEGADLLLRCTVFWSIVGKELYISGGPKWHQYQELSNVTRKVSDCITGLWVKSHVRVLLLRLAFQVVGLNLQ